MKKTLTIVLILLLVCTMCIGLTGCGSKYGRISPFHYALNHKFSFGKFEKVEIPNYGAMTLDGEAQAQARSPIYDDRAGAMLKKGDPAYESTMSKLQALVDKYGEIDVNLRNYEHNGRAALELGNGQWREGTISGKEILVSSERGDVIYRTEDSNPEVVGKTVIDGKYLLYYSTALGAMQYDGRPYSSFVIDVNRGSYPLAMKTVYFNVTMFNLETGATCLLYFTYEFVFFDHMFEGQFDPHATALQYAQAVDKALTMATPEEVLDLSDAYQNMLEEIMEDWRHSPFGKAFIENGMTVYNYSKNGSYY